MLKSKWLQLSCSLDLSSMHVVQRSFLSPLNTWVCLRDRITGTH